MQAMTFLVPFVIQMSWDLHMGHALKDLEEGTEAQEDKQLVKIAQYFQTAACTYF